ncbi:uncharacterized protein LOC6595708 [Drosophila persimilis]|uniref:uncharacterized protein LOC6595708 n=1 Tax=Drosophila persimilis TaxID=7234 RepID=UPI000F0828A4|nr:uncharacterized protein LOC6595708 [Drosophila persimilis]
MSCLTRTLQLLQVLTSISGCNIYKYAPKKRAFQLSSQLNMALGVLHGFWLRPWLLFIFLIFSATFIFFFIDVLVNLKPNSDGALNLFYLATQFILLNDPIFISYIIAYIYVYQRKRMRDLLNRFARIYYRYRSICGQGPTINWWLFLMYMGKMASMTMMSNRSLLDKIPFFGPNSIFIAFLRRSGILFGRIQPFLLGVTAHLGLLILYSCYILPPSRPNRRQLIPLIDYYKNLIQLRRRFEPLIRPLIWICIMDDFIFFVITLHLFLSKEPSSHSVGYYFYTVVLNFSYPLCLVYVNLAIDSAQREFGHFKKNCKPERQLQMFWLYRLTLHNGADKSDLNVFRLNRGHILEVLSKGFTWAMFTYGIYVNSNEFLKNYERVKEKRQ